MVLAFTLCIKKRLFHNEDRLASRAYVYSLTVILRQYLNDALVILGALKMVPHYLLQSFSGGNKGSLFGSSVIVNLVCVVASVSLIRRAF